MTIVDLSDPLYSPDHWIRVFHQTPHLNSHYKPVSNQFDWSPSYYDSLFYFPGLIYGAAFVFLCGYKLVQWFRVYCYSYWTRVVSCTCPEFQFKRVLLCNPKRSLSYQEESYEFRTKLFYVLCASLGIVNCFVFFGNEEITSGYNTFNTAATNLQTIFSNIADDGAGVAYVANATKAIVGFCNLALAETAAINYNLTMIVSYGDTINDNSSPVVSDINTFFDDLTDNFVDKKEDVVVSFFCVVLVVCLWFVTSLQQQSYFYFRFCLIFAWPLLYSLALFALFFGLGFIMALADFCMNPAASSGSVAGPNSEFFDVLSYYITCSGVSPFQPSITSINELSYGINATMVSLQSSVTQSCYNEMQVMLGQINSLSSAMATEVACPNIYNNWAKFMYSGVCHHTFNGLVNIWIVQVIEIGLLFSVMCVGAVSLSAFIGFEEDRATNGALLDWKVDDKSFAPITTVKLSPEEAVAKLVAVQQNGSNALSSNSSSSLNPVLNRSAVELNETKYQESDRGSSRGRDSDQV